MLKPTQTKKKHHLTIMILLVLLLISGFLRLWNLAEKSLWVDEVNTVFAAQSLVETGKPVHPSGVIYRITPLFTQCVAYTYQKLGVNETASRFPAALFGIIAVILVFYLAKEIFDSRVGLLSAFLMTFSHFEVGWSRVSRPYTLLQVFTLLIVLFFIKGFENQKHKKYNFVNVNSKPTIFYRIRYSMAGINISFFWLALFLAVLAYSILEINDLTIFLAGGLLCYLLFMSLIGFYWKEKYKKIINKYTIVSGLSILGGIIYFFISQKIQNEISFFLDYTPPWAVEISPAQNSLYLFNFLITSVRFPLAVFFFLGCVYLISRRNRSGLVLFWVFVVPLFILSFVFTHRVPRYIFYVYPFFLILSSYGFINVVRNEIAVVQKDLIFKYRWIQYAIVFVFFIIFLISPWFRMTLKIPFQGDGVTNMAVTSDEWREAATIVKDKSANDDLIIASLPQVAYYYDVYSDYGLNWTNLNKAKIKSFKNMEGRWVDIYVGIPCIESLEELIQLVESNDRGWILISKYHFDHPRIIPSNVKEYITNNFKNPLQTKRGTVFVFNWPIEEG